VRSGCVCFSLAPGQTFSTLSSQEIFAKALQTTVDSEARFDIKNISSAPVANCRRRKFGKYLSGAEGGKIALVVHFSSRSGHLP